MKVHGNARTTPQGRARLIARIESGETAAAVAQALGVSVRTVRKWIARERNEGAIGLVDRSTRPHGSPARLSPSILERICSLRQARLTGEAIARELGLPRTTVSGHLTRLGLGRLPPLQAAIPAIRYERERPGELVHIDVKKLGRFLRPGHRICGRGSTASKGVGWDFLHVCVDDASRLAFVEICPDEKGLTAARSLVRAIRFYRDHHVRVERVMTDNGGCYRSHAFRHACQRLAIRHLRTRPYTPRTNGKVERFIQTLVRQWAYQNPYSNSIARNAALPSWVHQYNHLRPHASLGHKPPISRIPLLGQ